MNIKGKEILNFSVSAEIEGKTSYFDLDKRELPDDVKCTLYSLCKEISAGSTQTKGVMIEDLIKKLELFGQDGKGLYMLDSELASRTYSAPTLTL